MTQNLRTGPGFTQVNVLFKPVNLRLIDWYSALLGFNLCKTRTPNPGPYRHIHCFYLSLAGGGDYRIDVAMYWIVEAYDRIYVGILPV